LNNSPVYAAHRSSNFKREEINIMDEKDGAWYVISVAAIKADVHEQTLRHYERLGLISPARKGNSPHSPRLYSDRDIERVTHIRRLMRDLGVNLAGVEAILHMKDRMEQMQQDLQSELQRMQEQHLLETRRLKDIIERLTGAGARGGVPAPTLYDDQGGSQGRGTV
jgi:MerR family transcriptional regulator, heat shock protein HspR